MERRRRSVVWLSCSLTAALSVFAVFLMVVLLGGRLAPIQELKFWPDAAVMLASGLSRWWDILAAAAWGVVLMLALGGRRAQEKEKIAGLPKFATATFVAFLALGLAAGLAGLLIGVAAPPVAGLFVGLIVGLVVSKNEGRKTVLADGLDAGSIMAVGCGFGIGLTNSLLIGLAVSLLAVPLAMFFYGLGYYLAIGYKLVFSADSGRRG